MDIFLRIVAGLDIGKKLILACRRRIEEDGRIRKEVQKFGTTTSELRRLCEWLKEWEITQVAMEATGVYWKPIWNVLEDHFELMLVNPQQLKKVPGRKTDVKDCEWIAQLVQHGLLRPSFVPPKEIRELRDLTRLRYKFIREKGSSINRIHKVLEDCNVKLGTVASDIMGVSGKCILKALTEGITDPGELAALAHRLHASAREIGEAVDGHVTEHHRFQLQILLRHINDLDQIIEQFDCYIAQKMRPYEKELQILQTHPAIKQRAAECIIAEMGTNMNVFPTESQLSSWAGVSPGINESAGKRKNAPTVKGNKWLKRILTEVSWACARTKNNRLRARYDRLAKRRGKKKAICALSHTNAVIVYMMLKNRCDYRELGAHFYDRLRPESIKRYYVKRLQQLGYTVLLQPVA
jgi:transposase